MLGSQMRAFQASKSPFLAAVLHTIALVVAAAAMPYAQGQTGTLRVEVRDVTAPIAGATITAGTTTATTDATGHATLTLPAGAASVVVTKSGFVERKFGLEIEAGKEHTARLQLVADGQTDRTMLETARAARNIEDQAHPFQFVRRDAIERAMLRRPGDSTLIFNEIPGIYLQSTSPVMGTTIARVQGLPGRYTRLMEDGVALYGDRPGGHALLRIAPVGIERAEILKGAAGGFYGSDALAGAVNLISRRPGKTRDGEFLFSQSTEGGTDGVFFFALPSTGTWSSTYQFGGHFQDERDTDDDGWSDLPGYSRGTARTHVFWNNGKGRQVTGVAGVTIEKRKGGIEFAREEMETKIADGGLSGQMLMGNGYVLAGAGGLFVQSRVHDFPDVREQERFQAATMELTMRRAHARHTWVAGIESDWYALRSNQDLPSTYVSTRPGVFIHDDFTATDWLLLSGSLRADYHNLYDMLFSPRGSIRVRGGQWAAGFSAGRSYFTPRPIMEETEAAGIMRLTIEGSLDKETADSVSADVTHSTSVTTLTLTLFRTKIDNPALIDRATYTLRNEAEPVISRGVEFLATVRKSIFSATGHYTYAKTRELDGRALPLMPLHSGAFLAGVNGTRGRLGVEVSFVGEQRLDANPYRSVSEPFTLVGLLGEYGFGAWRVYVNADNLTDVRQTDWDPIARPARDIDGRYTVDAWAPLRGRTLNIGFRVVF